LGRRGNITRGEVAKVAELAHVTLGEDEIEAYTGQLDRVLGYMAQLDQLDTEGIEPTTHAMALTCPLRDDAVRPGLARDPLLDAAPDSDGEHFVVPPPIEGVGSR
jgi:aspartyl-tRNA(Asn)/glutamyl-tRNA(Gln) amidotransferase subunit C